MSLPVNRMAGFRPDSDPNVVRLASFENGGRSGYRNEGVIRISQKNPSANETIVAGAQRGLETAPAYTPAAGPQPLRA